MKKLFLSIYVLSVMLLLLACVDKKADRKADKKTDDSMFIEISDENFKAYLLENFDVNKDGEISLSEAKEVLEMDCSNRSIEALDGIEKFVNLERLNCSHNQLDELELRYNKKLNWIVCTNNVDPLVIYFAKSSPLTNKKFVLPKENETPGDASIVNPFDVSKAIFDVGKTNFVICLNE